MVFRLTQSFNRRCKDNLGGVRKLYLFPYVKYLRSQIVTDGEYLVSFPTTTVYEFESESISFSEPMQENEGGKFFNQSLNFSLVGNNDYFELQNLVKKDYRIILQDRNGHFKILGLYTGLECTNLEQVTGGGKSDLNGFNLSFTGQEYRSSLFIENLVDAGFIIDVNETQFRILESGEFRVLENNDFRILE